MINLKDLETKGYCVLKNFLNEEDVNYILNDFNNTTVGSNKNYKLKRPSLDCVQRVYEKVSKLAKEISSVTDLNINMITDEYAFVDNQAINFRWHQEHEPFFTFQQLSNYAIFYMPIVKLLPNISGIDIIPFDELTKAVPEYVDLLKSNGARGFGAKGDSTIVREDSIDHSFEIPVNFENIKVTPNIMPGDLVILRGNVIHRTQDSNTHRVAFTVKFTDGEHLISKSTLLSGGETKQRMINNNRSVYNVILTSLVDKDVVTAREVCGTTEFKLQTQQ
jgi:hypothetical protein